MKGIVLQQAVYKGDVVGAEMYPMLNKNPNQTYAFSEKTFNIPEEPLLSTSGYTLEEISAETGYAIDSIRQILRAKCPEEYRASMQETITIKELKLAEDPRKITTFPIDGKKYIDITDMIAVR